MISYHRGGRTKGMTPEQEAMTWESPAGWGLPHGRDRPPRPAEALKISAFYRAVDIRSSSIGKYPVCVKDLHTRKEVRDHYLGPILWDRPNEAMTPFDYKKLLEVWRLVLGNAYVWIYRDKNGRPVELIPLPPATCSPCIDPVSGKLWYLAAEPKSHTLYKLDSTDILHYKGFSFDGVRGVSLLTYAARTLQVGTAREEYERAVYENGGHPAGVLQTATDLTDKKAPDGDGEKVSYKDVIRREWDRVHAGAGNALRVAVLDNGLTYTPVAMSNTDAQFVQNKAVTVEDIARFTGVPMHKLFTGKQAYNSNEANSIDYVTDTIQPAVTAYEEEDSHKLLTASERSAGLWLPRNMLAELRGDSASRVNWYEKMHNLGAYSVNDIRAKEDESDVAGGDVRVASLNFVPLEDFVELSRQRNGLAAGGGKEKD